MTHKILFLSLIGILLMTLAGNGQGKPSAVHTNLEGFEEVPAVSTGASGDFQARIDPNDTQLTYVLQYKGLSANATQAHIHFGARATNGGVSIWLCGAGATPGPAGTPVCPGTEGTVMRTVTAADVVGPAGQGIAAGEFTEILQAIRDGAAYANVHSSTFPGGEIRGQIRAHDGTR